MGKRRFTEVWRVWAVMAAIVLATLVVTLRLVQLQIVDHAQYAADARLIHYGQDTLADRRGARRNDPDGVDTKAAGFIKLTLVLQVIVDQVADIFGQRLAFA